MCLDAVVELPFCTLLCELTSLHSQQDSFAIIRSYSIVSSLLPVVRLCCSLGKLLVFLSVVPSSCKRNLCCDLLVCLFRSPFVSVP